MAHVVFFRGVNVGGHRRFRPAALAASLRHLGAVNIGAAGTFVIRAPIARADLAAELSRRLPFETEIAICSSRDLMRLIAGDAFAGHRPGPGEVRFLSVLARPCRSAPALPMQLPSSGRWLLKIVARDGRFVVGVYRRHMKVIGYLGSLDRLFGVPLTTRNWNTIEAIAKAVTS
jgi:uncharacterized protein (DUF1697 family)